MANEAIRLANMEIVLETAVDLFIKNGIQNTTREMIVRASGLSRRSTERYFPTMTDFVVQSAEWMGRQLRQHSQTFALLQEETVTAAQALRVFLEELKELLLREPRLYICFSEFKAYLFRNSENPHEDYRLFSGALGYQSMLQQIFELGELDGTVHAHYSPDSNARYLINTIVSYFTNVVLLFQQEPDSIPPYLNKYINDTWEIYCLKNN
jgi:AcrR family transcriptional regulator